MKPIRFIVALAMSAPLVAQAQQDWREMDWGEFFVRIGSSYVDPNGDATPLKFAVLQHWDLYNTTWEFNSDTTWNVSAVWRPMEHWGVELVQVGDAQYDIDLAHFTAIPGRDVIPLGDFKVSSSTAFINWYPLGADCLGRPYFGIGVNYTDFRDGNLSREFSDYLIDTDLATGRGSFNLGYSWGWATQLGVDFTYSHDTPFLANLSVLYFQSDTTARVIFPTRLGHDHLRSDVDYDPWVVNLSIGYKF
ncbi:OmpW/AlkL family protein [Microbulbifer hainanensis]|uniref:OmpW/AlkL family protein n=1 Tax=Microbulbifer hainanensis TaxID=2735675 RepID=UPI001868DDD9|nr:OmpW family outer membrane protein [Microbulbifer hainanensis]